MPKSTTKKGFSPRVFAQPRELRRIKLAGAGLPKLTTSTGYTRWKSVAVVTTSTKEIQLISSFCEESGQAMNSAERPSPQPHRYRWTNDLDLTIFHKLQR